MVCNCLAIEFLTSSACLLPWIKHPPFQGTKERYLNTIGNWTLRFQYLGPTVGQKQTCNSRKQARISTIIKLDVSVTVHH